MGSFIWNSRKLFRVLFESRASFRLHRSSRKDIQLKEKTVASKLLDLSAGGCGIESPVFVPVGAKLNLFLDRNLLGDSAEKGAKRNVSKIIGAVRTSKQVPGRKYRLGVQFEKISATDQRLIQAFVEKHERRSDQRVSFPNR